MSRLLIHVEGETEETFVNEVLASHLCGFGYTTVKPRLIGNARQRDRRGGIRPWNVVRKDILNHLKEDAQCLSTTMVDYYGLPQDGIGAWPGRAKAAQLPFAKKAISIENALLKDVCEAMGGGFNSNRFVPYVMMHEFEGLLFSDTALFGQAIGKPELSPEFQAIRDQFVTPEEINDSPITAPSKRIKNLFPGYQKPLMGLSLKAFFSSQRRICPSLSRQNSTKRPIHRRLSGLQLPDTGFYRPIFHFRAHLSHKGSNGKLWIPSQPTKPASQIVRDRFHEPLHLNLRPTTVPRTFRSF